MDFKQIQELIKLINKSNIGEVTIEEKGFKITVKQKEEHIQQVISAPFQSHQPAPTYTAPAVSAPAAASIPAGHGQAKPGEPGADNLITIKNPVIAQFF